MKNILDRFDRIIDKMQVVNKSITSNGYTHTTGYGPRFRRIFQQNGKRIETLGLYDYHTKKYVLFHMINMVGTKSIPPEFAQMERMLADAEKSA